MKLVFIFYHKMKRSQFGCIENKKECDRLASGSDNVISLNRDTYHNGDETIIKLNILPLE